MKKRIGLIITGMAFTYFFLITCYKLTNASLWFDETVEYWYSKVMFGELPFVGEGAEGSVNMYERIITTYQPPLYNVVMFFWLKISDSETWFKLFGVILGFLGTLGIYKAIKRISNSLIAAMGVFFSASIYQLIFYWQECGEYCLMLGTLCWTIYFWICLMEEVSRRNIILFTISAIIPVYSQYGAVFPVAAMIMIAFFHVLMRKDKKRIIDISIAYFSAFVIAALPLYFLFLRKQILKQRGGEVVIPQVSFVGGIIKDMLNSLVKIVQWNLLSYYDKRAVLALTAITLIIILSSLIFGKSKLVKKLIWCNFISFILYYFCVKLNLYSYGAFGSRYNLFFIPMWVVLLFAVCLDICECLKNKWKIWKVELGGIRDIFIGASICFVICFCIYGWEEKIKENWTKDDIRGVVSAWYEHNTLGAETLVYYAADSGFSYYIRQDERFNEQTEKKVHYMEWLRDKSTEEYIEWINGIYGLEWPDKLYIAASHYRGDLSTLVDIFIERGYVRGDIYISDVYYPNGGILLYFVNPSEE